MRLTGRRSSNIEDRRGRRVPLVAGGGIGVLILLVAAFFFGLDPGTIIDTPVPATGTGVPAASPGHDELRDFVAVVLADTEDTWAELFRRMKLDYVNVRTDQSYVDALVAFFRARTRRMQH